MRVSLIGAYGYTGRLICKELQKLKINFSIYGRNSEKLIALKREFNFIESASDIDLRNENDVNLLLFLSDIVINCAGPFTEESPILLNKIAESGKVYIDITGEIGFVKASYEKFNDLAKSSNSLILHACAFESLIADLGLQLIAKSGFKIKEVKTFYHFDDFKVSPGTRMTMKLSKFRSVYRIENQEWVSSEENQNMLLNFADSELEYAAVPYPLPEIAFSTWNYKAEKAASYLMLPVAEAKFMNGLSSTKGNPLETLDTIRKRKPNGPSEEERAKQKSLLFIVCTNEKGEEYRLILKSIDMYLLTAESVAVILNKLLSAHTKQTGVLSPAQVFKNQEKEILEKLNVEIIKDPNFSIVTE